jgi:hypothetical protein
MTMITEQLSRQAACSCVLSLLLALAVCGCASTSGEKALGMMTQKELNLAGELGSNLKKGMSEREVWRILRAVGLTNISLGGGKDTLQLTVETVNAYHEEVMPLKEPIPGTRVDHGSYYTYKYRLYPGRPASYRDTPLSCVLLSFTHDKKLKRARLVKYRLLNGRIDPNYWRGREYDYDLLTDPPQSRPRMPLSNYPSSQKVDLRHHTAIRSSSHDSAQLKEVHALAHLTIPWFNVMLSESALMPSHYPTPDRLDEGFVRGQGALYRDTSSRHNP